MEGCPEFDLESAAFTLCGEVSDGTVGGWLNGDITIRTANADTRYDCPFYREVDRLISAKDFSMVRPVASWRCGKIVEKPGGCAASGDRHHLRCPELRAEFGEAAKFIEMAFAGELVFVCDQSFSRPLLESEQLAVRVVAPGPDFFLEAFIIQRHWFYAFAQQYQQQQLFISSSSSSSSPRKLGLVFDLDETLVQLLSQVPTEQRDEAAKEARKDGRLIEITEGPHVGKYLIKRPGVTKMLESLQDKYQLHVFCMGWQSYADAVVDACGWRRFFKGTRLCAVVSGNWTTRLGLGPEGIKDFRGIFPFYRYSKWQGMVAAVDDKASVWDAAGRAWDRGENPAVFQIKKLQTGMSTTGTTIQNTASVFQNAWDMYFKNRRWNAEAKRRGNQAIYSVATNMKHDTQPTTLYEILKHANTEVARSPAVRGGGRGGGGGGGGGCGGGGGRAAAITPASGVGRGGTGGSSRPGAQQPAATTATAAARSWPGVRGSPRAGSSPGSGSTPRLSGQYQTSSAAAMGGGGGAAGAPPAAAAWHEVRKLIAGRDDDRPLKALQKLSEHDMMGMQENSTTGNKKTLLMHAAEHGQQRCVEHMLGVQSVLGSIDWQSSRQKCSALHYAITGKHRDCVIALVNAGASTQLKNSYEEDAAGCAAKAGDASIQSLLAVYQKARANSPSRE